MRRDGLHPLVADAFRGTPARVHASRPSTSTRPRRSPAGVVLHRRRRSCRPRRRRPRSPDRRDRRTRRSTTGLHVSSGSGLGEVATARRGSVRRRHLGAEEHDRGDEARPPATARPTRTTSRSDVGTSSAAAARSVATATTGMAADEPRTPAASARSRCTCRTGRRATSRALGRSVRRSRRELRASLARHGRWVLELRVDRRDLGVARERHLTGEAAVQHAAQGVDVGAAVDVVVPDLLRRHVVDGADELPGACQAGAGLHPLRDAEVGQERVIDRRDAGRREQDVPGFHVAMDQPGVVCGVQRRRRLPTISATARPGSSRVSLSQQALEVGALDVPHRDVQDAVGLARVVDRDDVGMVEARRRCGTRG